MSPLVLILTVIVVLCSGPDPVIGQITSGLQSILKNTHLSKDYGYPTDITRDLLPVSYLRGSMLCFVSSTVGLLPRNSKLTSVLDSGSLP